MPSPLAPESDEEKAGRRLKTDKEKDAAKDTAKEQGKPKRSPCPSRSISTTSASGILALPIPARNYVALLARKAGSAVPRRGPSGRSRSTPSEDGPSQTLHKFDLKTRKTEKMLEGIGVVRPVLQRREDALPAESEQWTIAARRRSPTGARPSPAKAAPLKLDAMEVCVDPRAEWKQMYHEVWRIERDFFYDPGLHGLDLEDDRRRSTSPTSQRSPAART